MKTNTLIFLVSLIVISNVLAKGKSKNKNKNLMKKQTDVSSSEALDENGAPLICKKFVDDLPADADQHKYIEAEDKKIHCEDCYCCKNRGSDFCKQIVTDEYCDADQVKKTCENPTQEVKKPDIGEGGYPLYCDRIEDEPTSNVVSDVLVYEKISRCQECYCCKSESKELGFCNGVNDEQYCNDISESCKNNLADFYDKFNLGDLKNETNEIFVNSSDQLPDVDENGYPNFCDKLYSENENLELDVKLVYDKVETCQNCYCCRPSTEKNKEVFCNEIAKKCLDESIINQCKGSSTSDSFLKNKIKSHLNISKKNFPPLFGNSSAL